MFDSPKWLFFLLFGAILVTLFIGVIDAGIADTGNSKLDKLQNGSWVTRAGALADVLTWDYNWLSGNMELFAWVFRILNIGFGILLIYQGIRIAQGFIP